MRKFVVLIIASVISVGAVSAQDAPAGQALSSSSESSSSSNSSIGFKVMVGAGFPSYEGLPAGVSTETDAAWSVGAFANWSTSGVISVAIQPELLYVHESGVASSPTTSTTSSTSSLRAPILFKLQLFDRNIVQPSLYGGPSLSYILSAKQKTGDVESDIQDIHKFQFGFAIGVDVTILRFIVVDLRYNTKFSEITSDVSSDLKGVSFSLNSFRAGLGVRF